MVKSRAEICRDYRNKLKTEDKESYLRKERERRRKNYIPTHLLNKCDLKERRRKNRETVKRCRQRQKQHATQQENNNHPVEEMDTSGYESVGTPASASSLVVAMQFPRRSEGPRMRISNALLKANKKLAELKAKNIELMRKLKTEQRRKQRLVISLKKSPKTPKGKADALMKKASLSTVQRELVRKELVFGNAVADQIRDSTKDCNKGSVKSVHMIIAGEILRKYRCGVALCYRSGLNKNTFAKYRMFPPKNIETGQTYKRKFEDKIVDFLERDDNSRMQPGKADKTKCGQDVRQTRVLTDYLESLHKKFLSENPESNVSFATFCRIRPKYIQLSAFISRSSCLCTKHQNMALTTKALRKEGILVSVNPEKFVDEGLDIASVEERIGAEINLSQWKRVEIEDRGKRKYVMRIVQSTLTSTNFIKHVETQSEDFKMHVSRVKTQYENIRELKQNLPQNHVALHMDFAENYACRSHDEIQSAYFNQTGVTLHPVVMYYRDTINNDLKHKSFVLVSDTQSHNSSAVLCFLDSIIPEAKALVPDLQVCHYWTDSPTSQYRNKLIFDSVANHKDLYGCFAVWNYFEAGHGKGPCDGLGGTVKRMADIAVKTGKTIIQDATDFYSWAIKFGFANVVFKFVSDLSIVDKVSSMKDTFDQLRPVPGTMKVHAVYGAGKSTAFVRDTSCYCQICISGNGACQSWRQVTTRKVAKVLPTLKSNSKPIPIQAGMHLQSEGKSSSDLNSSLVTHDFVAAVYGDSWYIGQVINVDLEDGEVEISFMEQRKQLYRWPSRPDKLWVNSDDVLCTIDKPIETGKSKRMFQIANEDKVKINSVYVART